MIDHTAPPVSDDGWHRLLLEMPAVAVHAVALDDTIVFWNRAAAILYGYSAAEALGQRRCELIVPPDARRGEAERLQRIFATGNAAESSEWHFLRKDGSAVRVQHHQVLMLPASSTPQLFCIDMELPASHGLGDSADSRSTEVQAQLHHLAFYDPLTRLPNRRLLLDRLTHALAASSRQPRRGAIMFLDLDNFKTLNDTQGHDVGDQLLCEVAGRLRDAVRQGDTVARLGGDEFVVMLEDLDAAGMAAPQAEAVATKILRTLQQTYRLERTDSDGLLAQIEHHCTASIGITLFGDEGDRIDDLLKQADLAMYQAKDAGRNAIRFFDANMQSAISARAELEFDLRQAIRDGAFVLHYQPQVVGNGRLVGLEALLRWRHPRRGDVPPARFIPLAEETGLILPLGEWVLEAACKQLAAWAWRPEFTHVTVSVNISARQIYHPDFVGQVTDILERTGADPRRLKLELTESVLVRNVEDVIAKMKQLKAVGVSFSLDDFGTGYSSLSYLKRLPLEQLKIDRSFVQDVLTDVNDAAIARMVIALAQSMGLSVVAEGVESEPQRDFLSRLGCHAYQGYLFSRPLTATECEQHLGRL